MGGDDVPWWLKAAVFISGTMVVGAMCAHFSGEALWQKKRHVSPIHSAVPKTVAQPELTVPKAVPVSKKTSTAVPTVPVDGDIPSGRGVSLSLPAGAGSLREQLAPEPAPAPNRPAPPP